MRKRVYSVYPRWRWQAGGLLFLVVTLVVVVLLKLQGLIYHDPVNSVASSEIQKPKEATPKIAFLFLARHRLSLDFLWEHFFQVKLEDDLLPCYILSILLLRFCLQEHRILATFLISISWLSTLSPDLKCDCLEFYKPFRLWPFPSLPPMLGHPYNCYKQWTCMAKEATHLWHHYFPWDLRWTFEAFHLYSRGSDWLQRWWKLFLPTDMEDSMSVIITDEIGGVAGVTSARVHCLHPRTAWICIHFGQHKMPVLHQPPAPRVCSGRAPAFALTRIGLVFFLFGGITSSNTHDLPSSIGSSWGEAARYTKRMMQRISSRYFSCWWVGLPVLQVEWGEASMIQAERLLLTEALKDPLNHRFILVSDRYMLSKLDASGTSGPSLCLCKTVGTVGTTVLFVCLVEFVSQTELRSGMCSCIPLYNFRYVYDYVLYSQKSFVDRYMLGSSFTYTCTL